MGKIWIPGLMPIQLLLILTAAFFAFVGVNWYLKRQGRGIPKFAQAVLAWITAYVLLRFVLYPPIPSSLLYTYMGLITIVLFLLVSSDEDSWTEFKRPILNTLEARTPGYRGVRTVAFVALPLLIGFGTYDNIRPKFDEPIELRTVHPAPPASVKVHGKNFTLQTAENPFRVDESGEYSQNVQQQHINDNPFDPNASKYMQYVREGGAIFFQNCHFCHGDNLDGRGMFAFAFNPIPANFVDSGTIAQLQETFVFWRVAKGGPGLPREGFPWASAMPPWEQHLTTDEMWKAILFEYWHTGFYPRTWD
ncbi:MAG: cytochrome c [Nitrospiria bacterium]